MTYERMDQVECNPWHHTHGGRLPALHTHGNRTALLHSHCEDGTVRNFDGTLVQIGASRALGAEQPGFQVYDPMQTTDEFGYPISLHPEANEPKSEIPWGWIAAGVGVAWLAGAFIGVSLGILE